jgi:hypothetical protein
MKENKKKKSGMNTRAWRVIDLTTHIIAKASARHILHADQSFIFLCNNLFSMVFGGDRFCVAAVAYESYYILVSNLH